MKTEIGCGFDCRIIRGTDDISALSKDWDNLFNQAYIAPPYLSRALVQTFITEKNVKGKPLLVTAWCDSKLVAILPLTIHNYLGLKLAKVVPTNFLCCTGILIDPEFQEAIDTIVDVFRKEKIAHILYNKYTSSEDIFTNKLFEKLNKQGFTGRRLKHNICLKGQVETDFDEFLRKNRTRKQREKLLYHERRVYKSGNVTIVKYVGKQITPEIIARLADIQKNSWIKEEGKAVLVQPFYQKLLLELGRSGIGCAWILNVDNEDTAFLFGLRANNNFYMKWMSYKRTYGSSTLSYGKVLYTHVIRDICNEGISLINFGLGESRWKRYWATEKDIVDIVISGKGFIGNTVSLLCGILLKCSKLRWKLHQRIRKIRNNFNN